MRGHATTDVNPLPRCGLMQPRIPDTFSKCVVMPQRIDVFLMPPPMLHPFPRCVDTPPQIQILSFQLTWKCVHTFVPEENLIPYKYSLSTHRSIKVENPTFGGQMRHFVTLCRKIKIMHFQYAPFYVIVRHFQHWYSSYWVIFVICGKGWVFPLEQVYICVSHQMKTHSKTWVFHDYLPSQGDCITE